MGGDRQRPDRDALGDRRNRLRRVTATRAQGNLWLQEQAVGAFGFSRPEDVATNPSKGNETVIASTGVDTYVGGVDPFGTIYAITTDFKNLKADPKIVDDGDDGGADPNRRLRSPDNLDWADDGRLYIQEDRAEFDTLAGEPPFGAGAANRNEAGIVRMKSNGTHVERIADITRGVVLDCSLPNPTMAFDRGFGDAGNGESSGIVDVSTLFGEKQGTPFLFDVQAHGIIDQQTQNPASRSPAVIWSKGASPCSSRGTVPTDTTMTASTS